MRLIVILSVLFGAIGLFATGFNRVSAAVMRVVGPWFRNTLGGATISRHEAFVAGLGAGAGSGGMSAVVSLLSLLDNGATEYKRSVWVLLGINLGATALYWIVALAGYRLDAIFPALALIAISLPLPLSRRLGRSILPDVLLGIALLMIGIDFMSGRTTLVPAPNFGVLFGVIQSTDLGIAAPAVGILLGVALSALIRSSVGATITAMSLLVHGALSFDVAAGMCLGANVGAALSGLRAASGLNIEARRTALSYVAINLTACIWAVAAITPFIAIGEVVLPGGAASTWAARLALFGTVVHLFNPLLVRPLQPMLRFIVERFARSETEAMQYPPTFTLKLLPQGYPEAINANLFRLQAGLARMAELSYDILMLVINATQVGDAIEEDTERAVALREEIKGLETEITTALTSTVQLSCSREQAEWIQQQQLTAQQLALISDDCYKTMRLLSRSYLKNYRFHQESRDELFDFTSQILDFLKYNSDYLDGKIDQPNWETAIRMEERIDKGRDKLKQRVRKVLKKDDEADVKAELVFIDIVSYLEHVGDRCLSIAESVRRSRSRRPKLLPHKD